MILNLNRQPLVLILCCLHHRPPPTPFHLDHLDHQHNLDLRFLVLHQLVELILHLRRHLIHLVEHLLIFSQILLHHQLMLLGQIQMDFHLYLFLDLIRQHRQNLHRQHRQHHRRQPFLPLLQCQLLLRQQHRRRRLL